MFGAHINQAMGISVPLDVKRASMSHALLGCGIMTDSICALLLHGLCLIAALSLCPGMHVLILMQGSYV